MISGAQKETLSDQLVMLTDRDHLMYLGDHLGIDKRHCLGLIYSITKYLLSLRLITLASDY
ncbi:hypothetical protein CKAH01_18587 [Colletotrichum kahawae]|uniref:Uncharacterized protein n=1 Tax=Colletotrichum kahawae TaxID=34407 RepID=A0AAE0D2G0_COLKA|nr:hypothetical protein CKAH01_18587 [Colletotrichum kahawae]